MRRLYAVVAVFGIGLNACISVRPVLVSTAPGLVFHKEAAVAGVSIITSGGTVENDVLWVSGEFMHWINREDKIDWGIMPHLAGNSQFTSGSMFVYLRKWFMAAGAGNPWGNIYGGLQTSINEYVNDNNASNRSYDFPLHAEVAFAPGIYREKYNVAFPLRWGMGTTLNHRSSYMYAGPSLNVTFNVSPTLILQSQFNGTIGIGVGENALYLPIPSLLTLGLYYRF